MKISLRKASDLGNREIREISVNFEDFSKNLMDEFGSNSLFDVMRSGNDSFDIVIYNDYIEQD